MALLTLTTRYGDCFLTITEHGKKFEKGLVGVDGLVLVCDEHGELGTYGMLDYPKYSAAKRAAFADGASHVGVDRLVWL